MPLGYVEPTYEHDPTAVLDYPVDWSDWLDSGEDLSDSDWTVPEGIDTEGVPTFDPGGVSTIWLTGGDLGEIYRVTNHVTTTTGREDDRSFRVRVVDR